MTHDDFITIVRQPERVKAEYDSDLKELVDRYPYFVPARMLYVKALQDSHNIHYAANLKISSVYCDSRRWLYYYLHPEKMQSVEPYQRNRNGKSSGDYFDMMNLIESEGGDTKQSLKSMAERLRNARAMVQTPILKVEIKPVAFIEYDLKEIVKLPINALTEVENTDLTPDISESNAKKLIREHKYPEAIEILRALNLNNPKKSVYFADQIRFLEKVIANSKK